MMLDIEICLWLSVVGHGNIVIEGNASWPGFLITSLHIFTVLVLVCWKWCKELVTPCHLIPKFPGARVFKGFNSTSTYSLLDAVFEYCRNWWLNLSARVLTVIELTTSLVFILSLFLYYRLNTICESLISKSCYWRYEQARLNFWYQCDSNFQNAEVDAELASEFFEVHTHMHNAIIAH